MRAFDEDSLAALERLGRLDPVPRRGRVALGDGAVRVVRHGWFRLFRRAAFVRDVTLALAGPGELLAPGALFGDRSAESGAQALTAGTVLVLGAEDLAGATSVAVAASLAARALRVARTLEACGRAGVEARVAAALLDVAHAAGTALDGGRIRLELPLQQADLAGLAGTTRESCSLALGAFRRRGLVTGTRLPGLVLTDPAALARLTSGDPDPYTA